MLRITLRIQNNLPGPTAENLDMTKLILENPIRMIKFNVPEFEKT